MNLRARQLAADQACAAVRDRALRIYLRLRLDGYDTETAWAMASGIPEEILRG